MPIITRVPRAVDERELLVTLDQFGVRQVSALELAPSHAEIVPWPFLTDWEQRRVRNAFKAA